MSMFTKKRHTEYMVLEIDEYGDVEETQGFDTLKEARKTADRLVKSFGKHVVIEKEVGIYSEANGLEELVSRDELWDSEET